MDTFGAFTMSKLNKQQKLEIYHDWKLKGLPVTFIASQRKLNAGSLDYMIHLIDRYGIGIYDQPNETFTKEFKEQAIEQALTGQQSITKLSLELGLRSQLEREIRKLRQENLELRIVNAYVKKLNALDQKQRKK